MKHEEEEFTRIVHEHRATIYSVCYMFAECSDEADELFQEALIRLWQGFEGFEHRSSITTWIYRVSLNTCITHRGKKQRHKQLKLDIERNLYTDTDKDSRQMQQLHERIHRLPPIDRAIVLLWLENMSYDEIAAIVGITPKALSVRLYRIKEELKRMSNQ